MGLIVFQGIELVENDVQVAYDLIHLECDFLISFSLAVIVNNNVSIVYFIFDEPVHEDFTIIPSLPVSQDFTIVPSYSEFAILDISIQYILGGNIDQNWDINYNIVNYNLTENDFDISYVLLDNSIELIDVEAEAYIGSQQISLKNFELVTDISSYCWSFNAELLDINDWALCSTGSLLTLVIQGISFIIRIDGKHRKVVYGNQSFHIEGRSQSAILGDSGPFKVTKTWENVTALDVVTELCNMGGILFEYHLPNWSLPNQVLSLNAEPPIEGLRKIVSACGGFMYTTPGGILQLLPAYKTSPATYSDADVDYFLSSEDDLVSLEEQFVIHPKWNAVTISNNVSTTETTIKIEKIEDIDDFTKKLWVIVFPFVDSVDLQTSYDTNIVSIIPQSNPIESIQEETIEIVNGIGSVKYPIFSIESIEYHTTDLGSIDFDGVKVITQIIGQSLLSIRYTTRVHEFIVVSTDSIDAQFFSEGE